MAKSKEAASSEGQGLTKKQLKRRRQKQQKLLAGAEPASGACPHQNVAALESRTPPEKRRKRKSHKSAAVLDENVPTNAGGKSKKFRADGASGGASPVEDLRPAVLGGGASLVAEDDDYIRNSLVGKVAEALLRKQLEEEVQAGPAKKKARLENKASEEEPPVEPLDSKPPASTKKETTKPPRKSRKQKGERQEREGLGVLTPGSSHQGSLEGPGAIGEGVPVEPLNSKPEQLPALTKKEKGKLKKERNRSAIKERKKERRKQKLLGVSTPGSSHQGSLEGPGAIGEVAPVEPLDSRTEELPALTKKEKSKLKKERNRSAVKERKKERRKQKLLGVSTPESSHQESLESPGAIGEVGSAGGVVPGQSSKKRQRVENDPRDRNKKGKVKKNQKGQINPALEGVSQQHEGVTPKSSSKKRQRAKEESQGKQKQSKTEQLSPWPEIKYEASSAEVSLQLGQSVMIDGAANLTLLSGGASVMGYRLRKDEEVLISSSGQLAPVPIIVHDRRATQNEAGEIKERGASDLGGLPGGERGLVEEQAETMLLVRSYWPKKGDAVTNQRTFRLEPKAPAGSSKTIPKPPPDSAAPSPGKTKPTDAKLHPVIISLAWKTVTDNILGPASATTREAIVPGQDQTGARVSVEPGLGGGLGGPPIVAVCGGKNVGKSTYGQYLVNRLLNSYPTVAFLETDVGQPELTAPGLLSLHLLNTPVCGPPSAHLRDPTASFFYGDVSVKTDPELYLRCVVALYDEFRRNYYDGAPEGKRIPLVINTHGWVKGLGLDVLIDILRYTVPTHVVDVQSAKANKNLPPGSFWETTAEPLSHVHYIPTAVPDSPDACTPFAHKSAPEERALRLLAHFQAATESGDPPGLGFSEKDAYSSLATCLVHHRPYQVPLDSVRILQLHGNVPPEEALWALNGAVVGLAKGPGEAETGPLPRCLGLGLVRGIDVAKGVLFLVTCLPLSELQGVNTLIQGKVDLPLQLLSAPPYVSPYLAFNSIAAEGTGSAMVKSRNNIVRKVGD